MQPFSARERDINDAERELVNRVRAGDERAFESVVIAHYAVMCSAAAAVLRSRDAVEDIVQEVLRRLWARRAHWDAHAPLRVYLIVATRNEAISVLRRMRRDRGLAGRIAEQVIVDDGAEIPWMARPQPHQDDAAVSAELRAAITHAA